MAQQAHAKTELFARWQQGSMVVADQGQSTGNRWWVCSTTGTDSTGYGMSPDHPFATLDYAFSQCTASNDDVIYLMPGHAETIASAAASPGVDVIGVRVVGLGQGTLRPTFTFTHVDANVIVSAASCSIENVLFVVDVDSVVEMVDVDADDFTLLNCEFREGSAKQWLTAVDINGGGANAADRCVVKGCKFISEAAGAVNAIEIGAVQDGVVIEGNWISGDFSDAAVSSGSILTNVLIKDNVIRNINAGDWAIELTAAATGLIVGNRLMADAAATCLDPGSCMCVDNYMVNAIDTSSIPVPTTAAGGLPSGAITAASFAASAINAAALAADAVDEIYDEAVTGHTTQGTAGQALISAEMCCEKSNGTCENNTTDDLFTISGGPIFVLGIYGIVSTVLVGATNLKLQLTTTTPSATVELNAGAVACDNDPAGALYRVINTTGIFTPVDAGWVLMANSFATNDTTYVMPPGTIKCHSSAAATGNIKWYLRYKPLSPLSNVTAAA